MTAEAYLAKIIENRDKIRCKEQDYLYWMELAKATTSQIGERVQSSGDGSGQSDKILEAVMVKEEIERLKQEIAEVMLTIGELPTMYYEVLHKVYVQGKELKEIAAEKEKSYSWAKATHSTAKRMIQDILDEREKI